MTRSTDEWCLSNQSRTDDSAISHAASLSVLKPNAPVAIHGNAIVFMLLLLRIISRQLS